MENMDKIEDMDITMKIISYAELGMETPQKRSYYQRKELVDAYERDEGMTIEDMEADDFMYELESDVDYDELEINNCYDPRISEARYCTGDYYMGCK